MVATFISTNLQASPEGRPPLADSEALGKATSRLEENQLGCCTGQGPEEGGNRGGSAKC
jgi:hypothetical protein